MKKRLNAYHQHCRIDPDEIEVMSKDEEEDPMPDVTDFLGLPTSSATAKTHAPHVNCPTMSIPLDSNLATGPLPSSLPQQSSQGLNWNDILDDEQHTTTPNLAMPDPVYARAKHAMNWGDLGPVFLDADTKKNVHELTPTGILDMLRMMIHLKLFIPLSMLTTTSLSLIHFNDNLKFKKIPFGNAVGKYTLNESHFPLEESLTDAKYLQVHKHWIL